MGKLSLQDIDRVMDQEDGNLEIQMSKTKKPMKLRSDNDKYHDDWWDERADYSTKEKEFYAHMRRWAMKQVGRPYDKVYSEFCEKFPERIGKWLDTRKQFSYLFKGNHYNWRNWALLDVDEQGIIRGLNNTPSKNHMKVVERYNNPFYEMNPINDKVIDALDWVRENLGVDEVTNITLSTHPWDEDRYMAFKRRCEKLGEYNVPHIIFQKYNHVVEYDDRSDVYKRYQAESQQQTKAIKKQRKTNIQDEADTKLKEDNMTRGE